VQNTVNSMGTEARAQWRLGRLLTTQRNMMEKFSKPLTKVGGKATEPASVIDAFSREKDAGYQRLLGLREHSPESLPVVARAVVDEIVLKATDAEGNFSLAKAATAWEKLGPRTRSLLFPKRELREQLGNLFTLSRMGAKDVNPSGTAKVMQLLTIVQSAGTVPAALLMGHPGVAAGAASPLVFAALGRLIGKAMYDPKIGNWVAIRLNSKPGTPAFKNAGERIKQTLPEALGDLWPLLGAGGPATQKQDEQP
jgi:hypothetical protein